MRESSPVHVWWTPPWFVDAPHVERDLMLRRLHYLEKTTGRVDLVQRYEHDTAPTKVGVLR